MACPGDETLAGLVGSTLPDHERSNLEAHLDVCPECRQLVALIAGGSLLTVRGEEETPSASRSTGLPKRRGDVIGRYRVERRLGVGGMGIVYLCTDPELDRPVAVKVLLSSIAGRATHRRRLIREARSLAALTHPHVVPVFDAGEHECEVFLAMEFVPGTTLREWLKAEARPRGAILEKFRQAAEGLAAAHDVGLVHCDFKPDNVMLTADGRALVTDFGLARAVRAGITRANGSLGSRLSQSSATPNDGGSHAGLGLVGTPAYMAPEQIQGDDVDPRADQFALCVALWEALAGQRPFVGRTMEELLLRISTGERTPPPPTARVPARLVSVLDRGLSVERAERWPDMRTLSRALTAAGAGPGRRARFGAFAAVTGVFAIGMLATEESASPCAEVGQQLAGAWDPTIRAELAATLLAIESPHAETTWRRAEARLEAYAQAWLTGYRDACAGTDVAGPNPEAIRDRRLACLGRARSELVAVTGALADVDERTLANADAVLEPLSSLARCTQASVLEGGLPEPPPAEARTVEAVRELLADAAAHVQLGDFEDGRATLTEAQRVAQAVTYLPLQAELALAVATLTYAEGDYPRGSEELKNALAHATSTGHRSVIFDAALGLMLLMEYGKRAEEGLHYADLAKATVDGDPWRLSKVRGHEAILYRQLGRYAEAERLLEQVLEYRLATFGRAASETLTVQRALARVHGLMGRLDQAAQEHEEVLALARKLYGPDHPSNALHHNALAGVLLAQGKHEEAVVHLRKAASLWEAALGGVHPHVAVALDNLGLALTALGRMEEAEPLQRRALRIRQEAFPAGHPYLIDGHRNLAVTLEAQGRLDEAGKELEAAIEHGAEAGRTWGVGRRNLSIVRREQGLLPAARALLREELTAMAADGVEEEDDAYVGTLAKLDELLGVEEPGDAVGEATADQRQDAGELTGTEPE
ncbi:MAG: tetratricopeptide repeat protein [Myxococcota bacterium]